MPGPDSVVILLMYNFTAVIISMVLMRDFQSSLYNSAKHRTIKNAKDEQFPLIYKTHLLKSVLLFIKYVGDTQINISQYMMISNYIYDR